MKHLKSLSKLAVVFTLMMLLTSCSGVLTKIKRVKTPEAKFVQVDDFELLKQVPHPEPRVLTPYNTPLIIKEYELALSQCNLKIEKIAWQQQRGIETNE